MYTYSGDDMYRRMIHHKNFVTVSPFITPPPPQNSPNHILNALSDECIQRVFSYLIGDIRDFLSAAEVCRKFQENAKKCFPSIYMDFDICDSDDDDDDHLPLHRVKSVLSIFGHLIQSISWEKNKGTAYESEIFSAIAEFCGKNLLRLDIRYHNLDFIDASKFEILDKLYLNQCNINNFKLPPTLKKLHLVAYTKVDNMNWMSQTHPNLIEIIFRCFSQLNDEMVIEFHALNPQLKCFDFGGCDLTSSILQGISTRLPNLVELEFHFGFNGDKIALQRKFERDVIHLSGLRHLKRLHGLAHRMLTSQIIDALADNNIPIEDLQVDGLSPCIVESVARLTNIRKLQLIGFSNEMVIDLVKKLPALQDLFIAGRTNLTLNGIKQILEQGMNLKVLDIHGRYLLIDSDDSIKSILDLARGRVQVYLHVISSNVHVSHESYLERNLGADYHWLKIFVSSY